MRHFQWSKDVTGGVFVQRLAGNFFDERAQRDEIDVAVDEC